jgi:hypothetical protein
MWHLHPNAPTTPAVHVEIARSEEPPGVLAHVNRIGSPSCQTAHGARFASASLISAAEKATGPASFPVPLSARQEAPDGLHSP